MKKLLFTCGPLDIGGIQRSLVALLRTIDLSTHAVDVMTGEWPGSVPRQRVSEPLARELPPGVRVLGAPPSLLAICHLVDGNFAMRVRHVNSHLRDIVDLARDAGWRLVPLALLFLDVIRHVVFIVTRTTSIAEARARVWHEHHGKLAFHDLPRRVYDAGISYAGAFNLWNEFMIDTIHARKKLCWIHGALEPGSRVARAWLGYLQRNDHVACVSESCKRDVERLLPAARNRVVLLRNIVDRERVLALSREGPGYHDDFSGVRFVSVSRLDPGKGFALAIEAMTRAIHGGCNIQWYIIGDGEEATKLEHLVGASGMESHIFLPGMKQNPYPFVRGADVFFHPSLGEGRSIAIDEAMVLGKPILVTRYPAVGDQVIDGETARIVDISLDGLLGGIQELYHDAGLRERLARNLVNVAGGGDTAAAFTRLMES